MFFKIRCLVAEADGLDAGVAFDGDADRCLCVDENGKLVDGDMIMAICALDLKKRGKLNGNTVVGTIMTNFGFGKFCEANDIKFEATKVGDRYVLVDGEGNPLSAVHTSDYMVSAQYATKGTVQYPYPQYAKDYMFVETKTDDQNGTYTYYMYYRGSKESGYKLCADVKVLNANGEIINASTVEGKAAYVTDYFYTKSGYLFMLDKNSSHG